MPVPPTLSINTMLADAATRLRSGLPRSGSYSILLSVGAGEPAASAAAALRRALEQEPRIVFASVAESPVGPVEDASELGAHVHGMKYVIEPPPQMVVSVSEANGQYYIAARLPAGDPLGPPPAGWLWVLSGR
jgi:hypothetical protein